MRCLGIKDTDKAIHQATWERTRSGVPQVSELVLQIKFSWKLKCLIFVMAAIKRRYARLGRTHKTYQPCAAKTKEKQNLTMNKVKQRRNSDQRWIYEPYEGMDIYIFTLLEGKKLCQKPNETLRLCCDVTCRVYILGSHQTQFVASVRQSTTRTGTTQSHVHSRWAHGRQIDVRSSLLLSERIHCWYMYEIVCIRKVSCKLLMQI